jgi:putative endopeptidase
MSLTSGIDSASLDPLVRPQDDLFRHYNGTWVREYEMPADRSSDGIFRKLHDEAEEQVRQIIETSSGTGEAQKDRRSLQIIYGSRSNQGSWNFSHRR